MVLHGLRFDCQGQGAGDSQEDPHGADVLFRKPEDKCLDHATEIRFTNGHMLADNLNGFGPNLDDEPVIRFGRIGKVEGRSIDLVVTSIGKAYKPSTVEMNGLNGDSGQLNIAPGIIDKFNFEFQYSDTKEPAVLEEFYFTFFDIDRGAEHTEELTVIGYESMVYEKDHEFEMKESKTDGENSVLLTATSRGSTCDNPKDPDNPVVVTCYGQQIDQKKRMVTFLFRNTAFFHTFFHLRCLKDKCQQSMGRNVCFTGAASLKKCAEPTTTSTATTTTTATTTSPTTTPSDKWLFFPDQWPAVPEEPCSLPESTTPSPYPAFRPCATAKPASLPNPYVVPLPGPVPELVPSASQAYVAPLPIGVLAD